MKIFTYILIYYLSYYHIGRRLANNYADNTSTAKLFGILSVIAFGLMYGLIEHIIKNTDVPFWAITIIVSTLSSITISFHIKS